MAVFAPPGAKIFEWVACGASNGLKKCPYPHDFLDFDFESSGGKFGLQPQKKW